MVSIILQNCTAITMIKFLNIFHNPPPQINPGPISCPPHSTLAPSTRQSLIIMSLQICLFWTFHIWNHITCDLLCLAYPLHNVFEAWPFRTTYQEYIPFYCQIIIHCIDRPHLSCQRLMGIWVVSVFGHHD